MTPEDWERMRLILESALELDSANRPAFLNGACADPSLRQEIESLIAAHDQAGTYILNSPGVPTFISEEELRFRPPRQAGGPLRNPRGNRGRRHGCGLPGHPRRSV